MEYVQPIRDSGLLAKMLCNARKRRYRDFLLLLLGSASALRISDLLGLNLRDIVHADGTIKDRVILTEKKTNKTKNFPLSGECKLAITEYLKLERKGYSLDEPLFPSRKGNKAIQRMQAWRIINDNAREVGINDENIGTHTMRKTFGYWAYQKGVPLATIQKLLNHSDQEVTLRYIGITQDNLDEVYLGMEFGVL